MSSTDGIYVIDLSSRTFVDEIGTGAGSSALAASADTAWLYVAATKDDEIAVVETATRSIRARIPVLNAPTELVMAADGARLYVAHRLEDRISVIDTATRSVVETIRVCRSPTGIDVGPFGQRLYVACYDTDSLGVVDLASGTLIAEVPVGDGPLAWGHFITPGGSIALARAFWSFDDTLVGDVSASREVTVRNTGTASVTIGRLLLDGPNAADFELATDACSARTLAPDGTCTVGVRFRPTDDDVRSATLRITSDSPDTPVISAELTGNGLAPDLRIIGAVDPIESLVLGLGTGELRQLQLQTWTLVNDGNQPLEITSFATADPLADPFTLQEEDCGGATLAPSESCSFTIGFLPTTAGSASDAFEIRSNDPDEGDLTIGVTGIGSTEPVGRIVVSDELAPPDDRRLDFGSLAAGTSAAARVGLFNFGSAGALEVSGVQVSGEGASAYTVDLGDGTMDTCGAVPITVPGPFNPAAPPSLQPQACTLSIRFEPTAGEPYGATLTIESDDPDQPTVDVELLGVGLAGRLDAPAALDLGSTSLDGISVEGATLTNGGTEDLTISAIEVTGDAFAHEPDGGLLPCGAVPFTLGPGVSCTAGVRFRALALGLHEGTMSIESDDPAGTSVTVALQGTGVEDTLPDGGVDMDAGVGSDAGPDAGPGDDGGGGGCGCRAPGEDAPTGALGSLVLLALLLTRRRRRDGG